MQIQLKNNALVYLTQTMWRYGEGKRGLMLMYGFMAVMATAVWETTPFVIALLMNSVQTMQGEALIIRAAWLTLAVIGISVLGWSFHGPSRVMETNTAYFVKRRFQVRMLEKLTGLPVRWHLENHSGEIIDQVAKGSVTLSEFVENGFEILHVIARFAIAIAVLTWFMPIVGIGIGIPTLLVFVTIVLFDRHIIKGFEETNTGANRVAAAIQDYLTNIKTVISLRLEERVTKEVDDRTLKVVPVIRKTSTLNETKWFTTSVIVSAVRASTLFGYIFVAYRAGRTIEVGTLYVLNQYLLNLGEAFFQFTGRYGDLIVKATKVRAVEHINMAFEREVGAITETRLPKDWQKLVIEDLTFQHPKELGFTEAERNESGIFRLNLTLERGKAYALVGESGSGKSTLLGLLRGLHLAQSATVFVDGERLPVGLPTVAHHTTLIPQDPEIFANSIEFNIAMGVEAPESSIRRAIHLARFSDVLARLPRGLQSQMAERGVSLSGGEKQRLALARGLFFAEDNDSEIILLDESTSSVDLHNERLIYEMLIAHFKSRVVLASIHKFNLLPLFDEIIVMEKGRIIERGTIEELDCAHGLFSQLWSQFNGAQRVEGMS